jgi:hypothetical protein
MCKRKQNFPPRKRWGINELVTTPRARAVGQEQLSEGIKKTCQKSKNSYLDAQCKIAQFAQLYKEFSAKI